MSETLAGLAVIIPTYNEERGIGPTLQEVRSFLGDVPCLVVDRSSDMTPRIAEQHGAKVVFQVGKGKGKAVSQGLRRLDGAAKFVVMTDGDFTYPAEGVRKFVRVLEQDPAVGMVNGNRFAHKWDPKVHPCAFRIGNKIVALLHNLFNGQNLADPLTGLRVLRAEVFKDWKPSANGFDLEVELNHHVRSRGYRILEVPILYRARLGKKKLGLLDSIPIFMQILKIWLRAIRQRQSHYLSSRSR